MGQFLKLMPMEKLIKKKKANFNVSTIQIILAVSSSLYPSLSLNFSACFTIKIKKIAQKVSKATSKTRVTRTRFHTPKAKNIYIYGGKTVPNTQKALKKKREQTRG